jgi:putative mycofactocin binding protein MftB
MRPESFGALIYDYDTRRLSFIKDLRLANLVRAVANHGDANAAFRECRIEDHERAIYVRALQKLLSMGVLAADGSK